MGENEATTGTDSGVGSTCSCKVGIVSKKYGIHDVDSELTSRWKGEGEEKSSLRELETYTNQRILRAALEEAGVDYIDGEVENYYRLLTDDETTSGKRVAVTRRLEQEGVDTDDVLSDFVSHQTIHTHLRECLSESYETQTDPEKRIGNARKFLDATKTQTQSVTEGTLEQLRDADVLDLEEFDVFVDVRVSCSECDRIVPVSDILEEEGCVCQQS